MASLWQWAKGVVLGPESRMIHFDNSNFEALSEDQKWEEENFDEGEKKRYYPVHIGDVFHGKYQVVGKLGYGVGSTVWLANDFRGRHVVAVKIFTNDAQNANETKIYEHLMSIKSKSAGREVIRSALDAFTVEGPEGGHQCLVHEPMLENVYQLLERIVMTESLLKVFVRYTLGALDYLHTKAHVIHTDLSGYNILLTIQDKAFLRDFIQAERKHPSPRKTKPGYTVYASRPFGDLPARLLGRPRLADLGSAVFGDVDHDEDVQPNRYRCPEVCLKAPWSYSIDIWNLGTMIWDLFEEKGMFCAEDPVKKYTTRAHLAEMIALMGPPPSDLLKRGKRSAEFFRDNGEWCSEVALPKATSLEESEQQLEGAHKENFLRFMRKTIQWRPEDRQTAGQLLEDEWLNS